MREIIAQELLKVAKLVSGAFWGQRGFQQEYNGYRFVRPINYKQLRVGQTYGDYYRAGNEGQDLFIFRGYSDLDPEYGNGGPKFNTIQEVMRKYGVRNLRDLENIGKKLGKEYGHSVYMCGTFFERSSKEDGCYYYLFNGRWSRGSGAEPLQFWEVEKLPE